MVDQAAFVVSARSLLATAAVAVSVAAGVLAPSVASHPAALAGPAFRLTSDAVPVDALELPDLSGAAASIGEGIKDLFNDLEPWAQYGANLLSWAVGWVPFAGLLAPQIIFFYDFGESVVQSLVFNTADLLDGTIDLSEALSNINSAGAAAFNTLINTETAWIQGLLPPPPPFAPPPTPPLADVTADLDHGTLSDLGGLPDPDLDSALSSLIP